MANDLAVAAVFTGRLQAESALALLEAHGIPSYISADDAGGMRPPLQLTQGVRLIVRARDLPLAAAVLRHDAP